MFSNQNGYSLADIAAATGNNGNNSFFGNDGWWIILLFLFAGWGGYGGGLFGGNCATGSGITDGYILTSDFANIERKMDNLANGLCDGFYTQAQLINGVNNSLTQIGYNNQINTNTLAHTLEMQHADINYNMSDLACRTRQAISDATASIVASQEAGTRAILQYLNNEKISDLQLENATLKGNISQMEQNAFLINQLGPKAPIAAYTVPNPYATNTCPCQY